MRLAAPLVLAVLLVLGQDAGAETDQAQLFAQMTEQLERREVLRAAFHQERRLKVLGRPLVSQGRLVFVAGEGVLWQVEDPYEVTFLIRPDEIIEWEGDNGPRRVAMSANPAFRLLTDMLLGAFAGDPSILQREFNAEALPSDAGWRLRLIPKSGDLSAAIAALEMAGGRFVEEVRVEEARGDAIDFTFQGFESDPTALNAAEKTYFAQ